MAGQKPEAPGKPRANHSFNVIHQGQRIASFLNRSKALSYAKDAAS